MKSELDLTFTLHYCARNAWFP